MGAEGKKFEWPKISMACCEIRNWIKVTLRFLPKYPNERCHPKLIRIADFLNIFFGLFLKYGSYLGWIPVIYYYNQRPIILPGSSLLSENIHAAKIFSESILEPKEHSLNFKAIGENLDSNISNLKPTEAPVQELAFETKFFKHHREKVLKKSVLAPGQNPVLNLKPFAAPKPILGDDVLNTAAWEKPVAAEKPEENQAPRENDWIFNPAPSKEPETPEKLAPPQNSAKIQPQNQAAIPPQAPVAPVNPVTALKTNSENPPAQNPVILKKVPKLPHPEVQVQPKVAPVYASPESGLVDLPPLNMAPPNRNFVFHNKMPKCGGTSMKYILYVLSEDNDFYLDYQPPCIRVEDKANCAKNGNDGTDGELELANHLAAKRAEKPGKFFLLKHHHWMNFTDVGMDQPTYINVIRHPMGRFNSVYYFQRYGFEKMGTDERQGARHTWKGSDEDFEQTLDQCVQRKSDECFEPTQVMVSYFCGTNGATNGENCKVKDPKNVSKWGHKNDWNKLRVATDIAKNHIVKNYYMIGILEHFNETLTLFSKMLPEYFDGAHAAKHDPWAVQFGSSSKTAKNPGYSPETAKILESGPLRYEMELYNLCKKIFYERLKYYQIELGEEVVFDKTKHTKFIPRHVHLRD